MHVVSNTSPLYYLCGIGILEILPQLYTSISIPSAVHSELTHPSSPVSAKLAVLPTWLEVKETKNSHYDFGLDLGESAAIALATEIASDQLLIDENKGREVARRLGINISGTLGVILAAANLKLIDGLAALDQLPSLGFYASDKLLAQVREDIKALG